VDAQQTAAEQLAYLRLTLLVAGAVVAFLTGLLVGQVRPTSPRVLAPTEDVYSTDVPRGLSGALTLYAI
jgi:hypothetical protein